jgi:hypothetical protein
MCFVSLLLINENIWWKPNGVIIDLFRKT